MTFVSSIKSALAVYLLVGHSFIVNANTLPEDETYWGRELLQLSSMSHSMSFSMSMSFSLSMMPDWESGPEREILEWPSPAPTPELGEHFCGNGIIEAGEECDDALGGDIGGAPYECGPYSFCNNQCQCEFPERGCLDRAGVVFPGHFCVTFGGPHACCTGPDGQDLCHECNSCQKNVALSAKCCMADGVTECGEDDICCPMHLFGADVNICLDKSHGALGDPCSPELCDAESLESEADKCQNCANCLSSVCAEYTDCLQNNDVSSCIPEFLGGSLESCEQCHNACYKGSKNGPTMVMRRSLRGSG